MRPLFFVLLALASVTGFYVELSPTWTWWFRAHLILHPLLGLFAAGLSFAYVRDHVRDKGWSTAKVGALLGAVVTAVWAACVVSGLPPLGLFRVNRNLLDLHGTIGWMLVPAFGLHVLRRTWLVLRERSRWGAWRERLSVPHPARIGVTVVLVWTASLFIDHWDGERVTVHFDEFLDGHERPALTALSPEAVGRALSMSKTCGVGTACHHELTEEFERSAHRRSPESTHFQKISALLASERGAPASRFCVSCHATGVAVAADLTVAQPDPASGAPHGFGCLVCHSMESASLAEHPGKRYAGDTPEGFSVMLQRDHLSLFPASGDAGAEGFEKSLSAFFIRLDPSAHARVMDPPIVSTDAVCLGCHQEHIPRRDPTGFAQVRCVDCHMTMQRPFSETHQRKPHYLVGANVVLPRLLGDAGMEEKVTSWLTGRFETRALDAFWELRQPEQKNQSKAVWLFMAVEPLAPAHAGQDLGLRVATSNVGIGHPFPSGVIDLYDVWLEVVVLDAGGAEVWRTGKPGGVASKDDGVIRLGGFVSDRDGHPIDRHRVWEQAERHIQAIDPNRTLTHELKVPIPAGAQGPLRVEARWNYDRLNAPFVAWAYAGQTLDLPRVVIASVEQKIPLVP